MLFLKPRVLVVFAMSLFMLSSTANAGAPLQNIITSYGDWKKNLDLFKKGCASDGKELSVAHPPDVLAKSSSFRARRWLYIPLTSNTSGIRFDGALKSKLANIEGAAKKHVGIKWAQAKAQLQQNLSAADKKELQEMETEISQRTGLAAARDLKNAVPEDILKSINYEKICDCNNTPENIAKDEAEYNTLTILQFNQREEDNKLKCFLQNASI